MIVLKSDFENSKRRMQYNDRAYNISVNSGFFVVIDLKTVTRGFLGSVMKILKSDVKNFKWWIQYDGLAYNTSVNSGLFCYN